VSRYRVSGVLQRSGFLDQAWEQKALLLMVVTIVVHVEGWYLEMLAQVCAQTFVVLVPQTGDQVRRGS